MIKIVVCRVGEEAVVHEVDKDKVFDYVKKDVLDGGHLEHKGFWIDHEHAVLFMWDEDARPLNLPVNRTIPVASLIKKTGELVDVTIRGNFAVTKLNPHIHDYEYMSLGDDEIRKLLALFNMPACIRCKKPLAYPGALFCGAACSAASEMHLELPVDKHWRWEDVK